MISRFGSLLAGAALFVAPILQAANNYTIQPPVLGFVFDQKTGSLYRIDGIPGASSLGNALDLGFTAVQATIAADQSLAMVRDGQGRTFLVDLTVVPPVAKEIPGVMEGATGMLISPSARSAALYSTTSGQLQFLHGLPGSPAPGSILKLGHGLGVWTSFAISDSGAVLASSADQGSGALFLLRPNHVAERIGGVQRASWLAFLAGTDDAVITDAGAGEILLIRDIVARRQVSVLASRQDRIKNPFAASPTADGRFVAVAMPGNIASVPIHGGVPAFVECACTPTSMSPLVGGNVFLLTDNPREPMRLAEVGATTRTLFVPALPADTESEATK